MKIFSVRENPNPISLQKAQGCFASNLIMPGLGSLAGGRKIGLVQLILCLSGFAITLGFGMRLIFWALAHWSEYYGSNPDSDPMQRLQDMWQQARWPLLGMILFAVAWLWALLTSRFLLAEAKSKPPAL